MLLCQIQNFRLPQCLFLSLSSSTISSSTPLSANSILCSPPSSLLLVWETSFLFLAHTFSWSEFKRHWFSCFLLFIATTQYTQDLCCISIYQQKNLCSWKMSQPGCNINSTSSIIFCCATQRLILPIQLAPNIEELCRAFTSISTNDKLWLIT